MQNLYNLYPSFLLFVGLLTVTDPDLELVRGGFVLLALVAFHPFVMYNSRLYPFLPHGRDFFPRPSPPLPVPIKLYTFSLNVLSLQNPPPPGNSSPFCWGCMDIFWNCAISSFISKIRGQPLSPFARSAIHYHFHSLQLYSKIVECHFSTYLCDCKSLAR